MQNQTITRCVFCAELRQLLVASWSVTAIGSHELLKMAMQNKFDLYVIWYHLFL